MSKQAHSDERSMAYIEIANLVSDGEIWEIVHIIESLEEQIIHLRNAKNRARETILVLTDDQLIGTEIAIKRGHDWLTEHP